MPFDVCPEETSYSMNHLVSLELDLCSANGINRPALIYYNTAFLKYKRQGNLKTDK